MRALYNYFKICAFLGTHLKQTLETQMQFETFHFYITSIVSVIKSSLTVKEKNRVLNCVSSKGNRKTTHKLNTV